MRTSKGKVGLAGLLVVLGLAAWSGRAESEEAAAPAGPSVSGSLSFSLVNRYLFRGADLTPASAAGTKSGLMFQPGLTLTTGPMSFAFWNSASDLGTFDEMDFTASYAGSIGPVGLSAGMTAYTYPGLAMATQGVFGTLEVFGTVGVDVLTSPSLGIYYDLVLDTLYGELGLGHSFGIVKGFDVALALKAGYTFLPSDIGNSSPTVVSLSVTPSYALGPVTLSLTGFYQLALVSTYKSDWYVALGTSFGF